MNLTLKDIYLNAEVAGLDVEVRYLPLGEYRFEHAESSDSDLWGNAYTQQVYAGKEVKMDVTSTRTTEGGRFIEGTVTATCPHENSFVLCRNQRWGTVSLILYKFVQNAMPNKTVFLMPFSAYAE